MEEEWVVAIIQVQNIAVSNVSKRLDVVNRSILCDLVVCVVMMIRREAKKVRIGEEHLWL